MCKINCMRVTFTCIVVLYANMQWQFGEANCNLDFWWKEGELKRPKIRWPYSLATQQGWNRHLNTGRHVILVPYFHALYVVVVGELTTLQRTNCLVKLLFSSAHMDVSSLGIHVRLVSLLLTCAVTVILAAAASDGVKLRETSTAVLIVVDQSGHGDYIKIQDAIDSVPSKNSELVYISVKPGTYRSDS